MELTKAQIQEKLRQIGIDPLQEQYRTEASYQAHLIVKGDLSISEALANIPDGPLRKKRHRVLIFYILAAMVSCWNRKPQLPADLLQEIKMFLIGLIEQSIKEPVDPR